MKKPKRRRWPVALYMVGWKDKKYSKKEVISMIKCGTWPEMEEIFPELKEHFPER
jgi:ribosome biogenesis protein Tsr3